MHDHPAEYLIVALDHPTADAARAMLADTRDLLRWVKVGSALFNAEGPSFVRELVADGLQVFLDLKLHDIPHQVALTLASLADLGVGLTTVHTCGGPRMLEAAVAAAEGSGISLLGVTVLTSLDTQQLSQVGVLGSPAETVALRTRLAQSCGLHGVVASAQELSGIRSLAPAPFEVVTPGIRLGQIAGDDQQRVATPDRAIADGASRLVVGRPITQAPHPREATARFLSAIAAGAGQ